MWKILKRSEMRTSRPRDLERKWVLSLGDVIGRVLQLDDKRGMMFGYTGFWGV